MYEPRVEQEHNRDRSWQDMTVPESAERMAPRAATLFLGKDHERWMRHDRDRLGLGLGWRGWRGVASAVHSGGRSSGSDSDSDDGSDQDHRWSSETSGQQRARRRIVESILPSLPLTTNRPRRFSTNGREAAALRHETVIGLASPSSRSSFSAFRVPSGHASTIDVHPSEPPIGPPGKTCISSTQAPSSIRPDERQSHPLASTKSATSADPTVTSHPQNLSRSHLKLAQRKRPQPVEGTLYDRTGPHREGAVSDGLSVRLFQSCSPACCERGSSDNGNDGDATTFLITTPDNRVSSAAKFRRWAMDCSGRFYAAMEIKTVEAKLRAADAASPSGGCSLQLVRELRESYLDDILDEVQKAETLNPGRQTVSKLLQTSDGRFVRLEEDYPEEAFFVIAGCEEHELWPCVALVFAQALRMLANFHNQGWMHGDVKLENLMFDVRGELVVIDYENANPYRTPDGDGTVQLVSYDWTPPEAALSAHGRRMGPAGDLWALGCNLVRAFALRDGIDDGEVRETLLGAGQSEFFVYRRSLMCTRRNSSEPAKGDVSVTTVCLDRIGPTSASGSLLVRFKEEAPELLSFVLLRCLSDDPAERGLEAEQEGLQLADDLERNEPSTFQTGLAAVRKAIELSGSEWVRPKLEEARQSLGLA